MLVKMRYCFGGLITIMLALYSLAKGSTMEYLFNSTCAHQMKTMSTNDLTTLEHLAPPSAFLERVRRHMKHRAVPTVLLLEVDLPTHVLALNHIECLRLSNATVVSFVVAYESGVCEKLSMYVSGGCFFDAEWSAKLVSFYSSVPNANMKHSHVYRAMLGRMMTTIVALCGGYNVFLSDSDIVYYRDPMQHVLRDADIMITSTFISSNNYNWGGFFYADKPDEYATMNNGVVFFRSTEVVRNLHITMATEGLRGMMAEGDSLFGFLQVIFNQQMVKHQLLVNPCSAKSNPVSKRFHSEHPVLGGNSAGECFDCYFGNLTWTSKVIVAEPSAPPLQLLMGVFPMERYLSHCAVPHVHELMQLTASAAAALKDQDLAGWGWGEDLRTRRRRLAAPAINNTENTEIIPASGAPRTTTDTPVPTVRTTAALNATSSQKRKLSLLLDTKTRPLSVHVNCIHGAFTDHWYTNKEELLKQLNSWFI